MPLRQYQELPRIAYTRSTVGWFQGSAYLVLTGMHHSSVHRWISLIHLLIGLLNISWSQSPEALEQPLNRAIAAMLVIIAWGSSAWYLRRGVAADGVLTAFAGVFQAYAALS